QATAHISLGEDEDETNAPAPEGSAQDDTLPESASPGQPAPDEPQSQEPALPEPSLEDATDAVLASDIPATAAVELPDDLPGDAVELAHDSSDTPDPSPLDADDDTDTAPEHTA